MSEPLRGILLDMDGVLYVGDKPVPGAAEAVAWCRQADIPLRFLTNTTSRPRAALVEKLARFGIEATEAEILTPPVVARAWLAEHVEGPVALFVPEATRAEFSGLPQLADPAAGGAGAVVLGDLGEGWDYPTLNTAFRLLMAEPPPPLVALGLTRYWKAPDGLRLDVGPFVRALEYASGREAVVLGKPARPFFQAALDQLGLPAAQVLMIGDDIRGDVGAAQAAGLRAALVRTGKFRPSDLEGDIRPDAVLDSLADLPAWWQKNA